jgi:hypothetical protein
MSATLLVPGHFQCEHVSATEASEGFQVFWTLANNQEINKASPAISALAARTTNLGCVM